MKESMLTKFYNSKIDKDMFDGPAWWDYSSTFAAGLDSKKYHSYLRDNHFVLELPLPGFKKEDINITVANKILVVKGKRKLPDDSNSYYENSFKLNEQWDVDAVKAKLEDGILTLTVPSIQEQQKKIIVE